MAKTAAEAIWYEFLAATISIRPFVSRQSSVMTVPSVVHSPWTMLKLIQNLLWLFVFRLKSSELDKILTVVQNKRIQMLLLQLKTKQWMKTEQCSMLF